MLIKSEILNKEFEVDTYNAGSGFLGIKDKCLYNLLINEMPEELEVNYDVQPVTATADYCAVKCTVTDNKGRKVQAFNDVSLAHLEKDDEFVKQHPLTQAVQSSVASAMKDYLGWPRLIKCEDNPYSTTTVIEDGEEPVPSAGPKAETKRTGEKKSDTQDAAGTILDFSTCTDEELGQIVVESGSYKGKTLDQIWTDKQSWFNYVSKSSSPKYDSAKEYVRRKNLLEETNA